MVWQGTLRGIGLGVLLCVALLAGAGCSLGPKAKAREHAERARAYMAQGKYREAAVEYQAALQKLPDDPDLLYGLAEALKAQGEDAEYRQTLARVLRIRPDHPEACLALAEFFVGAKAYGRAEELVDRVLKARPGDARALLLRARALTGLGRVDEARSAWQKVLEAGPSGPGPYAMAADFELRSGDPRAALEVLDRGIRALGGPVELRLDKAALLVGLGRTGEAEALLRECLEGFPDEPGVHAAWAKLLARKGRVQEAVEYLDRALERFRRDPEVLAALAGEAAAIRLNLGDPEGAARVLEEARKEAPGNARLAALLADVLITLGRTDEVRPLLPLARRADPSGRTAALLEARMYLEEGLAPRALFVLEPLVARGDLGVDLHYLYARCLALTRRWFDARREYLMVLDRKPSHARARLDYAHLLFSMGDPRGALAQLDRLPPGAGKNAAARLLRVRALIRLGRLDEARRGLESLRAEAPDNPVLLAVEGDLARAAGKPAEALEWYRRASEASPEAFEPVLARAGLMREMGRPLREIVAVLDAYQQRAGETPFVLNFLARLYLEEGDLVGASRAIDRSLLVEPNFWETRYLKARLHLAQGERSKAVVELEEAINLAPTEPVPYNALAGLYLEDGRTEEAEAAYRRLLDRNPREPLTSNNLAALLVRTGRAAEAVDLARAALVAAPANPHVMDTLGWALHRAGRPEEAAPYLERAARELPDSPEVLYHWAANLRERGKGRAAAEVAARIRKIAPESRFASEVAAWM